MPGIAALIRANLSGNYTDVIGINKNVGNSPETSLIHMPIAVISHNEAYRSALLAILADQGLKACAAFVESGVSGGEIDAKSGGQPGAATIRCGQVPEPQVVVVDGSFIADVATARSTWPLARLICSLDYIADWEHVRFLGADICVLKDQGLAAILGAITQTQIAKTQGTNA
ncbi:MAG: hypothetical protein HQ475_00825 [SAR202 cluster bacterium]|nr:hypothetical protein [SAR202 cluster bacterium]